MARRKYSFALLTVLLAVAPALQAADREAREWLERMSRSLATRNYEGRFFHVRNSRSESMRIIHRVDRGKVTERLVSLDGSGREIIRNQTEVICYLPDRRTVLVEKRTDDNTLLAAVPAYNEQLEAHYSIQRGPSTKALGRRTQVIMVQPRDEYRYGYRLWLDYETAMPLMSQLRDRNGAVIEQILFAEVNFRESIDPEMLKPAVTGEGYRWLRQDQAPGMAQIPAGWDRIRVPAGFRRTTVRIQAIAGSSTPVLHIVYSDGLASVSVFIEPRNAQTEGLNGLAKVGAAFAYSRNLDGHQVTAVGEVPAATVEAIAAGVTKDDTSAPLAREPGAPPNR